jgi:Mannosyl-glycoprotein endo-beta-N-acetylglucosaminidase
MRKLLTVVLALTVVASITVGVVATEEPKPAHAALPTVPVMGPNILSSAQIAAWYSSKHKTFAVPGISVRDLAQLFLSEGAAENIRGDIAFAQSIVETGYFGYVGSIVKPSNFNFAGMGACDSCNSGRQFPSPLVGVRAQIQDLRNYADAKSRAADLRHAPVPEWYAYPSLNPTTAAYNFDHFFRKGKAPTWNQMGNGNHATSPSYGPAVISVYQSMLVYSGLPAEAAAGADPVGNLEMVRRLPGGVRIKGWTVDPSTPGSTPVDIYVNGRGFARRTANVDRPDVSAAFSFAGSKHGFDMKLPIIGGTVCVYAINIGPGVRNPSLGCRTVFGPDPIANVEVFNRGPQGLYVRGWIIDPDLDGPAQVHVYADGRGVAALTADRRRPDVALVYDGYGPAHGFEARLPGVGGAVCLYGINYGPGSGNRMLGCKGFLGVDPIGHIDAITRIPSGLRIRGWTLDPDAWAGIPVDVYANGAGIGRIRAANVRNDVAGAYPQYGNAHGFDISIPIAGGSVCVYGINAGAGRNSLIGCRNA